MDLIGLSLISFWWNEYSCRSHKQVSCDQKGGFEVEDDAWWYCWLFIERQSCVETDWVALFECGCVGGWVDGCLLGRWMANHRLAAGRATLVPMSIWGSDEWYCVTYRDPLELLEGERGRQCYNTKQYLSIFTTSFEFWYSDKNFKMVSE